MKKIILLITFFAILSSNFSVNAFYPMTNYVGEAIEGFINSPDREELILIKDEATMYCEGVYMERRTKVRDYTDIENAICSDVFSIKFQEELVYKIFMIGNRYMGLY